MNNSLSPETAATGLPGTPETRDAPQGFTLIELMVVIAIIAIIAAIAIPQYTQSVMKAHRTDAKTALTDLAQREEKFYSVNNSYTSNLANLYSNASGSSMSVQSGSASYYALSIVSPSSGSTAVATYFKANAAPQGSQANDICGTFTIDSNGVTSVTGGTQTTGCW